MKKTESTVYVGIVTYNSARAVSACLDALSHQTYSSLRITLVDNCSTDTTRSLIRNYPNVTFIQNTKNVGFGKAHNQIIRNIKFQSQDYYLALNPDTILDHGYIRRIVQCCKSHNTDWGTGTLYK